MPTPDHDNTKNGDTETDNSVNPENDSSIAKEQHTASKMLSLFRQMEEQKFQNQSENGPKPLKQFTPPPDENRRVFNNESDGEDYTDEEVEEVNYDLRTVLTY